MLSLHDKVNTHKKKNFSLKVLILSTLLTGVIVAFLFKNTTIFFLNVITIIIKVDLKNLFWFYAFNCNEYQSSTFDKIHSKPLLLSITIEEFKLPILVSGLIFFSFIAQLYL